jgi:hypothetical protein
MRRNVLGSHEEHRVKLFVSKWTADGWPRPASLLYRAIHIAFGIPFSESILAFISSLTIFGPPTHSVSVSHYRNRGGPGVSHWLPHRPFVQGSWQSFYLTAGSFPTSTIPMILYRHMMMERSARNGWGTWSFTVANRCLKQIWWKEWETRLGESSLRSSVSLSSPRVSMISAIIS